ncbi:MAG: 23S rRNA (adenine(2503)-C(2))-methyltransferase RlmN [Ignavibacteria bacterium]|nr:MAG: 23S rRNA (adenine(2503)-C(2))-methyltransferase RlmN [Ignavibacteria bacterium]
MIPEHTQHIYGLSRQELQEEMISAGFPRYRADQLYTWLYAKGVTSFDGCRNLPKELRSELQHRYRITRPVCSTEQVSSDGTRKFLFELEDGRKVETVLIPAESLDEGQPKRLTICVSTQVGCPLDCKFCATASMKLKRNLTTGEILGQYAEVQRRSDQRISNLVFMGMGEPLLNYDNVLRTVDILTDEAVGAIAASHITLSTAGLAEGIRKLADDGRKIKLALSLHATTDDVRTRLMPINKKYPLQTIIDAAEYYYRSTRRAVTYEYILFDGINDADDDIRRLVKLTRRFPSKVNIIPFHPIENAYPDGPPLHLSPPAMHHIEDFADKLRREGVTVMLRSSSGRDIDAACGQLAVKHGPIRTDNI